MTINFAAIRKALAERITLWLPDVKEYDDQFKCPAFWRGGDDYNVSIYKKDWGFFDHKTGQNGDIIDIFGRLKLGQHASNDDCRNAAVEYLGKKLSDFSTTEYPPLPPPPAVPAASGVPNKPRYEMERSHFKHQYWDVPTHVWEYRDINNELIGYTARFLKGPDGKPVKEAAYTWYQQQGQSAPSYHWKNNGWNGCVPIYGAQKIRQRPDAPVLIVEGAKKCDAAQRLLPEWVVLSWPFGYRMAGKVDWNPLKDRVVSCWPDADAEGAKAAHSIMEHLPNMSIVVPPTGVKKGWDLFDAEIEGWDTARVMAYLQPARKEEPTEEKVVEKIIPVIKLSPVEKIPEEPKEPAVMSRPFEPLGLTTQGNFMFLAHNILIEATPSSLGQRTKLFQLAPKEWWENRFPGAKGGFDFESAADYVIQSCAALGVFSLVKARRTGVYDGGRVVHTGNSLIIDGEEKPLGKHGNHIYLAGSIKMEDIDRVMTKEEGSRLVNWLYKLNFAEKSQAHVVAGWLANAPICGSLKWRPHLWLTGERGTGKTFFLSLVSSALGISSVKGSGESTEAGIRQALDGCSVPIMLDEVEAGTNPKGQFRIRDILQLGRQATGGSDWSCLKGSATGKVDAFTVSSMMMCASIKHCITEGADLSRFAIVELLKPTNENDIWALRGQLEGEFKEILAGLPGRSIQFASQYLESNKRFISYAIKCGLDGRNADQLGTLAGGAWMLEHDEPPETEVDLFNGFHPYHEATKQNIDEQEASYDECKADIFSQKVDVFDVVGNKERAAIGELVEQMLKNRGSGSARTALSAYGIVVHPEADYVFIANTYSPLKDLLRNTPWADCWSSVLRRTPGGVKAGENLTGTTKRLSAEKVRVDGGTVRGVWLPVTRLDTAGGGGCSQ